MGGPHVARLFGNFALSIASRAKFTRCRLPKQAAESRTNCIALRAAHAFITKLAPCIPPRAEARGVPASFVTMPDTLTTNRPIPLSAHLSHIFLVIWPFKIVSGIARY